MKASNKPKVTKIVRTNSMNTSINRRDLLQSLKVIRTKGKTNTEKMTALNNINGSDWIGYIGDTDFEIVYPYLCQLADQ